MPLDIEPELLDRVQQAIDDIRAGKMIILVDDEDRENEGDLTLAADKVTPEAVNFMAKHGRGLICLTLTEEQVERLELPMMQLPKWRGGPPLGDQVVRAALASQAPAGGEPCTRQACGARPDHRLKARPKAVDPE